MCICVNCKHVDNCTIYHVVEMQHQQPHINNNPDFKPNEPSINVSISSTGNFVEV
ncbi:Ycf34 family protein, partial [Richelia intracellularis]|uniref:Ycf34 family protein n=1 Tax=Richelia intracellularis TaxID=1164990 RepID=UPI0009DA2D54